MKINTTILDLGPECNQLRYPAEIQHQSELYIHIIMRSGRKISDLDCKDHFQEIISNVNRAKTEQRRVTIAARQRTSCLQRFLFSLSTPFSFSSVQNFKYFVSKLPMQVIFYNKYFSLVCFTLSLKNCMMNVFLSVRKEKSRLT